MPHVVMLALLGLGSVASIQIVGLVADDPDESELAFSAGDTLTITFSGATTQPGHPDGLDRAELDSLFALSTTVDGDYWAHWNSSAQLVIEFGIVDPDSAPVPGNFRIECRLGSMCTGLSPPLEGAWGFSAPSAVQIADLVASDADDADGHFGVNDTLTLRFSIPTNRAGYLDGQALGNAEVEAVLQIDALPGASFSGVWTDPATLVLTVLSPGSAAPAVGSFRVAVQEVARLRDAMNATVR